MVQAQQNVNDSRFATAKHTHRPADKHNKKMGFWGTLGMTILALASLVIGQVTGNKRRLIL
jgi:hypothetical protein